MNRDYTNAVSLIGSIGTDTKMSDEEAQIFELLSPEVTSPFPDYSYANPEKYRVRYDADNYSVTLGDSYVAFGRGLALNMNRNVDIDLDSSIQGVKGVFRPGAWDITMVAGQVKAARQRNPCLRQVRRTALVILKLGACGAELPQFDVA